MKKTVAIFIAALLVVLSATTAFAFGKPPAGRDANGPAKNNDDKKAYQAELRLKKQTLQANHHELMKLRISVRTSLNGVKEALEAVAESGTITPALEAILPEVKNELVSIITELKALGNYGQLMRQINTANKASKGGNFAEALAQLDKLIAIQNEQKTKLQALKTRAEALLAKVKEANVAVPPSPTPTPSESVPPTETPAPTDTTLPSDPPAESPAA